LNRKINLYGGKTMANIFDDGMSAQELAILLAAAEEISDEERERVLSQEMDDPVVPDEDAPEWYEED
jgi:hypothetical protein